MSTLTVSHYLYLTKEQRYDLHNGVDIETIGICIPVWFRKGDTSEPAQEIFCKYRLSNDRIGAKVQNSDEGYEINMPSVNIMDNDVDESVRKAIQIKLGTSERLLDQRDGGAEWCEFRYYQKIMIDEKEYYNIHFVEIKPLEILHDTIG